MLLQLLHDLGEELRRHREVEGEVAAGAAGGVQLLHGVLELLEGGVVVEVAGDEPHALGELLPHLLAERGPGVLADGVVHDLREVLVLPVPAGEADEGEARRQQPPVGQVVHGRHQLLAGQVTGHTEDDQPGRAGDPGQAAVTGVPQRVLPVGGRGHRDPHRLGCGCRGGGCVLGHRASTPLLFRDFATASSSSCQAASNLATPSSSSCRTTSS